MTYLRGTTFREQTATRRISTISKLGAWPEPAVLPVSTPVPVPTGAEWIAGFLRAAKQTLSPANVIDVASDLYRQDPLLAQLSVALMAAIPVFAVFALFAPAMAHGVNPVNPWIKPIKFSLSFSTFASTISLFLLTLRIPEWQLKLARRMIAVSVALEIFSLGAQAWRTTFAAGSHKLTDSVLSQMTNSMVMLNTAIVMWMLALFFANRVYVRWVDRPMMAAIRYSIVIFLLGNAVGGYMLARGSHTVNATDAGPGLPFLNWSTVGGDLRIAHFIAIHAIQIVPLFAYILAQMAPIPAVKYRKWAVAAVAMGVAIAVGATFVQAALGRPLLSLR